ncbi:TetR/AcrR family transcriptional regulator [Mycobacterium talmoniae]|uniref:HTH-type transcriptional repressor n=1 Tax=Mycobacterium talmoniae TaxID=1858794 RepID=A0A1S1NUG8_9MYCO|nr:TetR/AcrR family transcriptional regulator [Mycobacterium talmoniae]OHV06944.1 hypothetical protein BKN37_00465 [Mycobacterium talmoniae]PQM48032.1 HTH-type transcriptional repressor [Mycobacterium talmoniae]
MARASDPAMSSGTPAADKPAKRRSSTEVRRLILQAALRLFAEKGYAATSTLEIATRAGVAESVIFRQFGDKAALFSQAALEPFGQFVQKLESVWGEVDDAGSGDEAFMLQLITELHRHVRAHKDELRSLLLTGNGNGQPTEISQAQQAFGQSMNEALPVGAAWETDRGRQVPRLWLRIRLAIAMVTAMVLFEDWFLAARPDGAEPLTENDLAKEIAGAVIRGLITDQRPPGS